MLKIKKSDVYDAAKRYDVPVEEMLKLLQYTWFHDKGDYYVYHPDLGSILDAAIDQYEYLPLTKYEEISDYVIIGEYRYSVTKDFRDPRQTVSAMISILPKEIDFEWSDYILSLPWKNFILAYEAASGESFLDSIIELFQERNLSDDQMHHFLDSIGYNF